MADAIPNPFPTVSATATDLPSLHAELGKPDTNLQRILFRNTTEEALYEEGIQIDSKNIVADVPAFVRSALAILASLDPTRRAKIKLPPGLFAVLIDETHALAGMKTDHDDKQLGVAGDKSEREATLRREMREGVALREITAGALVHTLSAEQMKQVKTLAGDAATPENLVKGMNAVAGYIDKLFEQGSDEDREALAAWGVTKETTQALRAKAEIIKEANKALTTDTPRVSQRTLDIHDGRVLRLLDMVLRAFRLARRSDASILVPELNKIAWYFDTAKSAKTKPKPAEEPPKPAEEPPKPIEQEPQPA